MTVNYYYVRVLAVFVAVLRIAVLCVCVCMYGSICVCMYMLHVHTYTCMYRVIERVKGTGYAYNLCTHKPHINKSICF